MFKLSKYDFHVQVLIAIVVLLLLWIPAFVHIEPFAFTEFTIFGWCFGWLKNVPFLGVALSFVFLVADLLLLYKTLVNNHIQSANTFFPEIVFLIFSSGVSYGQFSSETVAMLLILLSLQPLFNMGEEENDHFIFSSSLLIGLAALFDPVLVICCLLPISAIVVFGTLSVRKILLSLLGFIFCWIWVFAVCFLTDSIEPFWHALRQQATFGIAAIQFPTNWMSWSLLAIKIAVMIPVVFFVLTLVQKDLVINRRRMVVTFIYFILLILCFLMVKSSVLHAYLLFLPETILIIYLYEHLPRVKMVGFCVFLIFLLQLIGQWMPLFI